MQDLVQLNALLDAAKKQTGSDYKLAQVLNTPRQHVSAWRKGTREPTPEDMALIAAHAGLDGVQWLIRATVQKHQGTAKGDQLARVLGKALVATGAVIASSGANAAAIFSARSDLVASWLEWLLYSTMYRRVKFSAVPGQR